MWSGMFKGLGQLIAAGVIAMGLVIIFVIYSFVKFVFLEETYKSKIQLKPDVIISSKTINGIQKSDTTYVYHLK